MGYNEVNHMANYYLHTVYDASGTEVETVFTMQEAVEASRYFANNYPEYGPYHIESTLTHGE